MKAEAIIAGNSLHNARLNIRPLTADDSEAYRALRQKILAIGDGKYFSDSYTREQQFTTAAEWRTWCAETQEHCMIGIFNDAELIGIMGVVRYGPAESFTVEWEATWLDPRYRNCGIARHAYERVRQWTIDHGYEYAVVFIREDNERSRAIREKQGAIYLHTECGITWADGSVADARCFILDLAATQVKDDNPYYRAMRRLGATLVSMKHEALIDDVPHVMTETSAKRHGS